MSFSSMMKSLFLSNIQAWKGNDEAQAEERHGNSPFKSLKPGSEETTSDTASVVRYGNEDLFVFDEYSTTSVATVGLYLRNSGILLIRNPATKGDDLALQYRFAKPDWQIIVGDWSGNGVDTLGFYDPAEGIFMLWDSLDGGKPERIFYFGPHQASLIALAGDWDGDGVDTVGLYDPTNGSLILKNKHEGGHADIRIRLPTGTSSYIPIVGDWTGDGHDKVGLYSRSSGTFLLGKRLQAMPEDAKIKLPAHRRSSFPIAGDWNGDGIDKMGIFDSGTGTFYLADKPFDSTEHAVLQFGPRILKEDCMPVSLGWANFSHRP